jgi:uridine kinase
MKGDVLVIEEHHRRAAVEIATALVGTIRASSGRYVITVAGESGSGKSETAAALAEQLSAAGIASVVLGQDDYFVLPPRSNDQQRRADPEWLGPHC